MNEGISHYQIEISSPKRMVTSSKSAGEKFGPVFVHAESIELVVASDLETFGQYIAGIVAQTAEEAGRQNKRLVLDAATGGSPKAVWFSLGEMAATATADLSNVIVMGHEEAWGPEPGSDTDFDYQRKATLTNLGQEVRPITEVAQIQSESIEGNFVPMHFVSVSRAEFKDGENGEIEFQKAQERAAAESARRYTEIVRALLGREDVESLGVYGIGTDGHIGEEPITGMGFRAGLARRDAFVRVKEDYSVERGHFQIEDAMPNVYWKRNLAEGELYGRALEQKDVAMTSQEVVVGLGLRDMLSLDHLVLAFNNASKRVAFELAMEGSVKGVLTRDGEEVRGVERDAGEGEGIWDELAAYGKDLEGKIIPEGTVDRINRMFVGRLHPKKCGLLYKAIYAGLDRIEASAGDPIYEKMGEFSLRYIGRRSPLGQFIRMRELLGKKTTIVVTPEVVRGTAYESLAA